MSQKRERQMMLRKMFRTVTIVSAVLLPVFCYLFFAGVVRTLFPQFVPSGIVYAQPAKADIDSDKAFLEASKVFFHPRCVNCHPAGDSPLQGEESRIHAMRVKRGADGMGTIAMRCANCHQTKNQDGVHMPPGAPGWKLPPEKMPMVFEKKTPKEL